MKMKKRKKKQQVERLHQKEAKVQLKEEKMLNELFFIMMRALRIIVLSI